jgi:2-polyprenyl-3-methyl-5-hydroxy-6-metoxy-1,4-benzoquinol methylase
VNWDFGSNFPERQIFWWIGLPLNKEELQSLIRRCAQEPLPPWEEHYLEVHAERYRATLELLGPGKGNRLLDVGAFPGHLSLAARHLGFEVYGLTGRAESTTSLGLVRDRFSRNQIPIAMADVESEPFPYGDEFFDVVLASEIIEHLHYNPYRLLRESFRVLRPGGSILISTPNLTRLDNFLRLWEGRSIHSEIKGRFDESFSAILSARHLREYTAGELSYMLEGQNKEMYRFEDIEIHYSAGSEPTYTWPKTAKLIKYLIPSFHSTLMVKGRRPEALKLIHPEEVESVQGLYPIEEHPADMEGIAKMVTVPFRWSEKRAVLGLPASEAPYQIFFLNLVYLVPDSLPPALWSIDVKGEKITTFGLGPDRMLTQVALVLPLHLAEEKRFQINLSGPIWKPMNHPGVNDYEFSLNDSRELGVVVAWDGFLRTDCQSREELIQTARRECRLLEKYRNFDPTIHWRRLHHGYDDRWSAIQGLYLLQADFKSPLSMGPEDWRQLGPGWYFLENWKEGPVRWSSRRAEVYLSAGPGSRGLHLRVFSGDSIMGKRITGTIKVFYSRDRRVFESLAEESFDLPDGIWTDLKIHFNLKILKTGIIRLILEINESRIPARFISGSTDTRELGLAVKGIAVS